MRINLALILSIIIAVGMVALGFTFYQISTERYKLYSELEKRSSGIAGKLIKNNDFFLKLKNKNGTAHFSDSINNRYNLLGIAIYYNNDSIQYFGSSYKFITYSLDYISQSIIADSSFGNIIDVNKKAVYQYISPIKTDRISDKAVILYSDAEYINNIIGNIWFRNFFRWFVQV
jgi:hypothetical protein